VEAPPPRVLAVGGEWIISACTRLVQPKAASPLQHIVDAAERILRIFARALYGLGISLRMTLRPQRRIVRPTASAMQAGGKISQSLVQVDTVTAAMTDCVTVAEGFGSSYTARTQVRDRYSASY